MSTFVYVVNVRLKTYMSLAVNHANAVLLHIVEHMCQKEKLTNKTITNEIIRIKVRS